MLHPTIRRRMEPLGWGSIFIVGGAVALSLAVSAGLLAAQGKAPVSGILLLFQGGFGSRWAMEDSLLKAIPIFLCSLGVGVAFRLQIWNIGAEGQFALGAVGAAAVALSFPQLPSVLLIPAMMLASMAGGGLWGLIPGILKVRLRANEIIITLMLNYIGILFLDYLVYGPWKDPVSFGFPMTPKFSDNAVVGSMGMGRIHWGLLLCIGFGVAMWIFFRFTRIGYELRACGDNAQAARYAGVPRDGLVVMVMVLGGALAGVAGFLEASANLNRLQPSIMVGYGYTAIIVAWLARLNPLQIAVAAYLLAGLRVGVENLQLDLQVPAAFGGIVEGMILLSVLAGGFFSNYRIRFGGRP
jgi:simple sugar transport system permease protein